MIYGRSSGRSSNILRQNVEEKNSSLPGCRSLLSWTCFHCDHVSSPYCRSIGQEQQPLLSLLPDLRHYNYIHAHVILRAWWWWLLVLDTLACKKNIARMVLLFLREGVNAKKTFSFGHCPNDGGGGLPMPEFFGPLFRSAFLVNKKSLFLQKCQCIELLTVF